MRRDVVHARQGPMLSPLDQDYDGRGRETPEKENGGSCMEPGMGGSGGFAGGRRGQSHEPTRMDDAKKRAC